MNMQFQGATGNYYARIEQLVRPMQWNTANGLSIFTDRWYTASETANPYDPNTEWINGQYPTTHAATVQTGPYSYFLEDITYLRLKSIELGYTLPKKLTQKVGVESSRIYLSGYNLLTFSPTDIIDPERSSSNYSYVYPLTKTFTVGISLTF